MSRRNASSVVRAVRPGRRGLVALGGVTIVGATALLLPGTSAVDGVGLDLPRAAEHAAAAAPSAPAAPSAEPSVREPGAGGPNARTARPVPPVEVRDASLPEVPATQPPTRVVVDGLVDVEVAPVGVDPDGSMELPESGDVAGWYRFGAAPGDDRGTVVVASHVDTSDGVGQFAALPEAREGDVVTVMAKDGSEHRYRVAGVERYAKASAPLDRLFDRDGEHRLVLVTCGGRWLPEADSYEDNLVVVAVPDDSPRPAR